MLHSSSTTIVADKDVQKRQQGKRSKVKVPRMVKLDICFGLRVEELHLIKLSVSVIYLFSPKQSCPGDKKKNVQSPS